MMTGIRSSLLVVACVAAVTAVGCGGKSGLDRYEEKLTAAGFGQVSVSRDEEGSGKKKKLVAYDFDYVANTDGDDGTCAVELEYPANKSGSLKGDHWHVDEVNGKDVNGWGADSPDAARLGQLLQEQGFDC